MKSRDAHEGIAVQLLVANYVREAEQIEQIRSVLD